MKKLVVFLILLFIIPSAIADWFYNSQNIVANVQINGDAKIIPLTPTGYVESAAINMTFFPKQTEAQEVLRLETEPKAEFANNTLKFAWKNPEYKIEFSVDSDVRTKNTIMEIRNKIDFPIKELPKNVAAYTKASKTIDSNDEAIVRIASELAKGEDDLYFAVFKIADWTKNNIDYNLSTLTADVSQKASWVLQNRQGVCDELTSLFIAMLRAVGIPARFVSGISYTDSPLFAEKWGPHGWAEVYMPSYGWVPFDVTYGEFGWVDPTHIKFKESIDSDEPSTYYQWLGRNVELKTNELDIKTRVIYAKGISKVPLNIDVSVLKKAVKSGSYNLVEATIENLNDFYYATELRLSKPKEIEIIGNDAKSILLLPKEKKRIFWLLKVDDKLDSKYSYTFPLVVSTLSNISSEASFMSSIREDFVPLEEVSKTAKLLEEEKEKRYSGNVALDCKISKEEFYEHEDAELYCTAKNTGNVFLDNLDVCFENKCSKTSLGISQMKNFTFDVNKSDIGYREALITLKNELVSKAQYVNFKVNDAPKIEIEDLVEPLNLSYSQNFTISFKLAKKSNSNPKNVKVVFTHNKIKKEWHIEELAEDKGFDLLFEGSQLTYGRNDLGIDVRYYDGLGNEYTASKRFYLELSKVTVPQYLLLSFNKLGNISTETIVVMLLTGVIAFILVVLWVFRKGKSKD